MKYSFRENLSKKIILQDTRTEKNKNKIKAYKIKISDRTIWGQGYTLPNKRPRNRPETINGNQRTLSHNNTTIPIGTMEKRMQKGGKKSWKKNYTAGKFTRKRKRKKERKTLQRKEENLSIENKKQTQKKKLCIHITKQIHTFHKTTIKHIITHKENHTVEKKPTKIHTSALKMKLSKQTPT